MTAIATRSVLSSLISAPLLLGLVGYSTNSNAEEQFNLSLAVSNEDAMLIRIAKRNTIEEGFLSRLNSREDAGRWRFKTHLDFSLSHWETSGTQVSVTGAPDSLQVIAVTPTLRYSRTPFDNGMSPYVELGIGAALLSEDSLQSDTPNGVDFGSNFQFEDKLSFGARFGQQQRLDAALSILHYSNGGLAQPNDGADFYGVSIGYWY